MEFKISNFNIMSDKHFDFYTWDEVKEEEEANRNARYDQVINVITSINGRENINVMTFQEVTVHSIGKLRDYANNNRYSIYENEIKSVDRPILLATMIKNDLTNAGNIIDLTDKYQNFYNKNNYHSGQDDYFSGRAQVFYIRSKNLIVVNVHAPGLPDGFVQQLWYKNLAAFIRCGCMNDQNKERVCFPDNQDVRIILIGDFNVSDGDKIREWTNENNKLPILDLFNDLNGRSTSYHSGIKDKENNWKPDPNPYQKVDHLIKTNLPNPQLFVYVSNIFNKAVDNFNNYNNIVNKIIPYRRDPALVMDAANSNPKNPDGTRNPNYDVINAAPNYPNGVWNPNFDIDGWPSDHTFNLYVFPNIPNIPNIPDIDMLGGGNKTRKYRIIY